MTLSCGFSFSEKTYKIRVENRYEQLEDDPDLLYNVLFTAAVYPEGMETNIDDLTKQYGSVKIFLLVILDEATASGDSDNESYIQAAIPELCKGKTLLVIAHRLHVRCGT